ncbi:hypothetical protein ACC779_37090 [Rhizobium ruizarguesonis]
MVKQKLRLIYSDCASDIALEGRSDWGLQNARQLNLFDETGRIRILFVAVADVSAHHFIKALDEKEPYLVIDTRAFPDFFSVFPSIEAALSEFTRRGIKYDRIPLQVDCEDEVLWKRFASLKDIFSGYLERKTIAPVFVLSSTRRSLDAIADRLKGYISQELSEARVEEIQ